ncbi:hypothetical protein [Mycobacterium sp. ITM-2016-00318]|uniref:hypothetical protein n=1 Tax=Mycobacterium sp. ITM-2016-00318 TaxID=2099693 RepID=UPI001158F70B|nr:hypothetical protein [Mycobacterium sp. ITM-2016-00318]WNG93711.1 hypothetical protein C6A82_004390 [Mycobacterium sp. ITM-2016-00318]
MDVIRVSSDGLQRLAAQHVAVSAEVAGTTSGPPIGPPAQHTSAAVAGGYEALRAATGVLAARLEATGSKLSSAADHYAAREGSSALRLSAVASSVET